MRNLCDILRDPGAFDPSPSDEVIELREANERLWIENEQLRARLDLTLELGSLEAELTEAMEAMPIISGKEV
jgi:regulator of replication initiation timing